ncbi:hypothetical protein PV08_08313 [Exophiala spinifera]|uniref:AB hydrolase-1 domain-containing protein n=1 Tax=Exophiala spinifera TaxID=91928 RepID=A0A0D1YDN1_9EURO|nr:uncharacterized protein PV08_08313 [Exophiala spinifera]KIW13126.1 hypothetical protein PV08_08313 [Exophiala spinifera]
MHFVTVSSLALAIGLASARKCQNFTVEVEVSARNGVFGIPIPQTNIDVTNFLLGGAMPGVNATQEALTSYATVSGTYELAATYCVPDSVPESGSKTLQILTHGIGFDRSYWDLPFNDYNYSYVETAVDQYGYSTLSWDRLGIGASSHGDPLSVVQAPLEIAALKALTRLAWSGSVPGVSTKFDKIVHVGHSFGSIQTYALARDEPELSSGIVLTGFSATGAYIPYFLLGGNLISAADVPSFATTYGAGYLVPGDASGVHTNFLAPGQFDPEILDFAFATGQPVSVGELLTVGSASAGVNSFAGPVLVISGERDLVFCGGNCLPPTSSGNGTVNLIAEVQGAFPGAKPFDAFVVPGAGHGLNLDYSHETTYQYISQFLVGNGLC